MSDCNNFQIWRIVIESLDTLAPKGNSKWLKGKLNEIIGIVEVAATLGLNGRAPQPPKQIFPSSYFAPELSAVDLPSKSNFKDSSTSPTQHNIITKVSFSLRFKNEQLYLILLVTNLFNFTG